jgi:hypothetical protein
MEKHPLHLKSPELQNSPEVHHAVERYEHHEDEKVPNNPSERIEAYMDRLENIFITPDEETRKRNLEMFRDEIYDAFIIKKENFPESYFDLQKRIARERGQAIEFISEDSRQQMMEVVIEDQKHSLDAWMNYLTSDDAGYPSWFKYYMWNQITKLSQFDKERGEYKTRTSSTVAPFPDIYREPLAQIADIYESYPKKEHEINPILQKLRGQKNVLKKKLKSIVDETEKKELEDQIKSLEFQLEDISAPLNDFNKKFPVLYAELTNRSLAASLENKEGIEGKWVKYDQGDEEASKKLYESLQGKGTGWCTAGMSTAENQIKNGDFYVYYTNDTKGDPTQPRLAIRMDGQNKIAEVRGVLPEQNVEPILQETLDEKLQEFGGEAEMYKKKSADMKMLTFLENKQKSGDFFTKDELEFLYEIKNPIEGFGYNKDLRIEQIQEKIDLKDTIAILMDIEKENIATTIDEITEHTSFYVKDYLYRLSSIELNSLPKNMKITLFDLSEYLRGEKERSVILHSLDPKEFDFSVKNTSVSKEVYLNSQVKSIDWTKFSNDKLKLISKEEFIGKSISEVARYVAEEYGSSYIIPDLLCRQFIVEHDNVNIFLKDEFMRNQFYFFWILGKRKWQK